jgi:hypothetical protein
MRFYVSPKRAKRHKGAIYPEIFILHQNKRIAAKKPRLSRKMLFLQKSKGFLLLLLLLLTGVLYGFMVFVTIPSLQWTAGGLHVFDLMPGGYDALYAEQLLSALGA